MVDLDGSPTLQQYLAVAGSLLLIGGMIAFPGIITAEALYPGHSTSSPVSPPSTRGVSGFIPVPGSRR